MRTTQHFSLWEGAPILDRRSVTGWHANQAVEYTPPRLGEICNARDVFQVFTRNNDKVLNQSNMDK